jgi:hypothetical protein
MVKDLDGKTLVEALLMFSDIRNSQGTQKGAVVN